MILSRLFRREPRAWFDTMDVAAGLLREGECFVWQRQSYRAIRNDPEGVTAVPAVAGRRHTPDGTPERLFPSTATVTVIHSWGYHV